MEVEDSELSPWVVRDYFSQGARCQDWSWVVGSAEEPAVYRESPELLHI